eukprot:1136157-Pelagomonas_calceolata.AAC.8
MQGTDTLTCLIEGFRFFLSATPARLQEWLDSGRGGCRAEMWLSVQSRDEAVSAKQGHGRGDVGVGAKQRCGCEDGPK